MKFNLVLGDHYLEP